MTNRKNTNRGYQQLWVWQDARDLYVLTWKIFKNAPFELKKISSQQISSVDSIHRNIAEGYCRRGIKEYLQFLNIAQSSLGESVSSMVVYKAAGHLEELKFEEWDKLAYKLENGLKKLIEKLEIKRKNKDWEDGRS